MLVAIVVAVETENIAAVPVVASSVEALVAAVDFELVVDTFAVSALEDVGNIVERLPGTAVVAVG